MNAFTTIESPDFSEQLINLVKHVQFDLLPYEDDEETGELIHDWNDLTVGMNESGDWDWQSGDNSYSGAAYFYPHWAVVSISAESNPEEIAEDIKDQLADLLYSAAA